jgi:hypothetical protein
MESFYLVHLDELRSDFEGFARRFHERAPSYLEIAQTASPSILLDPLNYRGGPLRHTSRASDYTRLVSNLIGYAETLAGALAKHAASEIGSTDAVEDLTRLELRCPEAKTVVSREITSGGHHARTVRFPLPAGQPPASWHLHFESPSSIVELRDARWVFEGVGEDAQAGAGDPGSRIHIVRNACHLHHQRYFTFLKGTKPAVIELFPPSSADGRRVVALELHIRSESNAATIGSRLLHNDNLDRLVDPAQRIARLEQKIARRSTFTGALGFQFYRLWRAIAGPPRTRE